MHTVVSVVLPIFALILVGFVCRKTGRLGTHAASEINRMVVWLCLPALLFKVVATTTWVQIWQPGFILSFGLGCLAVFFITLLWRLAHGKGLTLASLEGLSAAYANVGYIGIPLCLLVFGQDGLEPAFIASLIVVCVLFAFALAFIEIGMQPEANPLLAVAKVPVSLLKNPLVLSPIAGAAWAMTGLGFNEPTERFLSLLADATTPAALVSLGLFLAEKQSGETKGVWPLVIIKLVAQPLITGYLAFYVFTLPPLWAKAAVLLSALPTGTGPYMLAEYYECDAATVSRSILFSTLCSLLTLSLGMYWLGV